MGILLKFVLFGLAAYYIFKTIGNFIFRFLGGQAQQQQQRQTTTQQKRKGEVNIDYVPENQKGKPKSGPKGGEYIDYEEVK